MSREKSKEIYQAKPKKFGNGAKLKAYKDHIGKNMVVMTKEYFDKVSNKPFDNLLKEYSDYMDNIDDKSLDKQLKMVNKLKKNM